MQHTKIGNPSPPSQASLDQSEKEKAQKLVDYFTNVLKMAKGKHGKAMYVGVKAQLEALLV